MAIRGEGLSLSMVIVRFGLTGIAENGCRQNLVCRPVYSLGISLGDKKIVKNCVSESR